MYIHCYICTYIVTHIHLRTYVRGHVRTCVVHIVRYLQADALPEIADGEVERAAGIGVVAADGGLVVAAAPEQADPQELEPAAAGVVRRA